MRTLHAIFPAAAAATFGCLLTAPVAFAQDGEDTALNLKNGAGKATENAAGASGGSIVRTIFGLAVVLGVIYLLAWILKKVKNSKETEEAGESLETIASLNLGPNKSLHLVRVGVEIVLLGAAEHQVTPIRRYSEAEAHALGLLEPPAMTLSSLATLQAEVEQPKGFVNILRSKTVVK